MKKFTLAVAAAAVIASPAFADKDMKHHTKHQKFQEPVAAPCEPVVTGNPFNGPYVGASLGMGIATGKQSNKSRGADGTILQQGHGRVAALGVLGGLNAGWDFVFKDRWLLGADFFADLSSMESDFKSSGHNSAQPRTGTILESKLKANWTVGAGAKMGAIVKNVLLYTSVHWVGTEWEVKGRARNSQTTAGTLYSASKEEFRSGVRVGLGMMMPVTDKIVFGMEAGYAWYESIKAKKTSTETGLDVRYNPTTSSFKNSPELFDIKAKIAWKFKGIA